jgi:hypothetical protein
MIDMTAIVEENLFYLYLDCLPHENGDNLERRQSQQQGSNSIRQRIALIRTPGVLGEIVDDFVTQLIEKVNQDNSDSTTTIEIIRTSHINPDHNDHHEYTHVIRPSILPIPFDRMMSYPLEI